MKDKTPQSSPSMSPYDRPPLQERLLTLRKVVDKRRGPNPAKVPHLEADDNFSPCDGYFLAAEQFLILAIEAKDDEDFETFSLLADAFETSGKACVELRHTL